MSKRNLREIIGEIKATQDIVDYIQSSAVSLKASSAGKFKGLCPFHGEKTPSFSVDSNFQNYRCFGCGASGDIVNFVQENENLSFIEAVKKLADLAGIEFEMDDSGAKFDYKSIRNCVEATAKFFTKNFEKLDDDHKAKREVTGPSRKLPLDGMAYGYAPEGRQTLYKHLKDKGFSNEIMLQAGVVSEWKDTGKISDFWHGRLMFIITDPSGKPVGFSGRKLNESDKRGKYVNSQEGPVFDKSSILFHHSEAKIEAKKEATIYVAEGQFDVAAIAAAGYSNVVAASGTAFTKKQLLMCSRMVGDSGRVVFCFDGDDAGKKAAYRAFSLAGDLQGQCYVVSLPEGQDPCDFRLKEGNKALRGYLKNRAVPIVEFVLDVIADSYNLKDAAQASRYVEAAATVLKTISSPSLRSTYAKRVALRSLMSIATVNEAIERAKSSEELPQRESSSKPSAEKSKGLSREEALTISQREEKFLEDLNEDPLKSLYARMLQLSLHQRGLLGELLALDSYPKPLKRIAQEVFELPEGSPVISERSKLPLILETVISQDYFPHLKLMDEADISSLFDSLREESAEMLKTRKVKQESRRVMEVLKDSNDPELLKMIQTEETHA